MPVHTLSHASFSQKAQPSYQQIGGNEGEDNPSPQNPPEFSTYRRHDQSVFNKSMTKPHKGHGIENLFFGQFAFTGLSDYKCPAIAYTHNHADNSDRCRLVAHTKKRQQWCQNFLQQAKKADSPEQPHTNDNEENNNNDQPQVLRLIEPPLQEATGLGSDLK